MIQLYLNIDTSNHSHRAILRTNIKPLKIRHRFVSALTTDRLSHYRTLLPTQIHHIRRQPPLHRSTSSNQTLFTIPLKKVLSFEAILRLRTLLPLHTFQFPFTQPSAISRPRHFRYAAQRTTGQPVGRRGSRPLLSKKSLLSF